MGVCLVCQEGDDGKIYNFNYNNQSEILTITSTVKILKNVN